MTLVPDHRNRQLSTTSIMRRNISSILLRPLCRLCINSPLPRLSTSSTLPRPRCRLSISRLFCSIRPRPSSPSPRPLGRLSISSLLHRLHTSSLRHWCINNFLHRCTSNLLRRNTNSILHRLHISNYPSRLSTSRLLCRLRSNLLPRPRCSLRTSSLLPRLSTSPFFTSLGIKQLPCNQGPRLPPRKLRVRPLHSSLL